MNQPLACENQNHAPPNARDDASLADPFDPPVSPSCCSCQDLSNATSSGAKTSEMTSNKRWTSPSRKRNFAALGISASTANGTGDEEEQDAIHISANHDGVVIQGTGSPPPKTPHVVGAPHHLHGLGHGHGHSHHHHQHDGSDEPNGTVNMDGSIDPTDLMLLKVIGRGTFAQQVALARHRRTQSLYVVKTLNKSKLVQRKQVSHTLTEKKVLEELGGHPFIVKLFSAFQTERELNFVLEFCQGGELFYHLQQQKQQKFDEQATIFYAAEVLSALAELHSKGIVYRDLKPENVLLDAQGHVKLADFGFAKQHMGPGSRTYSFCGSPEYLSPEMVSKQGHGVETDMWSFGCFCYELLTGTPPFQGDNLERLFDSIQSGRVFYPPYLTGFAVSLLQQLLQVDPSQRLTASNAMSHGFFQTIDWTKLLLRQVPPPIQPVVKSCECTFNFDDGFTTEPVTSLLDPPKQRRESSDDFGDF